jgi:hypothetical protein
MTFRLCRDERTPMTRFIAPRELAHRAHDGIGVTLLWDPDTDGVSIAVVDDRDNCSFVLPIARDSALDAFNHPYAYAPDWIGLRSESACETAVAES